MWSVKIRPKPGSTSLAARSFSDVGFVAGWISNFKLIPLLPAVGAGAISGAGLAVRACSNETPMDFSPGLARNARPRRGAVGYAWASSIPVLRRVTTPASPEDMLLRNGEVQYVCRNAARQSHGRSIRGPCRRCRHLRPYEVLPQARRPNVSQRLVVL